MLVLGTLRLLLDCAEMSGGSILLRVLLVDLSLVSFGIVIVC
jgi:hypothetical protein